MKAFDPAAKPFRIAVMISGGGRTLHNLLQHLDSKEIPAVIERVVCSRAEAPGVAIAQAGKIPLTIVERKALSDADFQSELTRAIAAPDLVCMAGFLSLWVIPDSMRGRVVNIHPALLPDFGGPGMYGIRVHQEVLRSGRVESGCTVHHCDNQYDHGPIIMQRRVPVLPTDTPQSLADRVFIEECIAYPQAIRQVLKELATTS